MMRRTFHILNNIKCRPRLFSSELKPSQFDYQNPINPNTEKFIKTTLPSNSILPRVSLLVEIPNVPGALFDLLKYFWKHEIDLTHIESRPTKKGSDSFLIYIDYEGKACDSKSSKLVHDLNGHVKSLLVLSEKEVPWFPKHISDLDSIANRTLDAGDKLSSDHPGFHDQVYRQRRTVLASIAKSYRFDHPLSRIEYTQDEISTWAAVYRNLQQLQSKYACSEYISILASMEESCGYGTNSIPQFPDISNFLMMRTGFQLRPVAGLLSSRDFLNALAFRVFFSTQYIRHSSMPLYTPEPDICHELLGHVPMFADPDFADFSQEIGLASLGASEHDIKRLATCYWHSVEFGLVKESNSATGGFSVKAYGAGLLSSFGELEYSCKPSDVVSTSDPDMKSPTIVPWEPEVAAVTDYPITTYQPTYFLAESLLDAKEKMRLFCEKLPKPFNARYNELTQSVWVDRAITTKE